MDNLRQDIDFHGLFRKLGHHLEEIRVRALENILSKLEHKLVCDADLVNERHLIIRLLEWFNFPSRPRQQDVLSLLCRLAQHTGAAEILQDVGGVEFLKQLRPDVAPSLQPIIDQILDHALRLPASPTLHHAPECIYRQLPQANVTGDSQAMSGVDGSRTDASQTDTAAMSSIASSHRPSSFPEPPPGYFQHPHPPAPSQPPLQEPPACPETDSGFHVLAFPWLPLTMTDRHVLSSTNASLQSKEVPLLVSACEFLSDVVLQDFSAEIFLQRPQIVKSLLSLLQGSDGGGRPALASCVAVTLSDLSTSLYVRMKYHLDPALYTTKQDFASSAATSTFSPADSSGTVTPDPRPQGQPVSHSRPRGDGRDGDSSASSTSRSVSQSSAGGYYGGGPSADSELAGLEETDVEEAASLQRQQMLLPTYCLEVMTRALPLLHTASERLSSQLLFLLQQTRRILADVLTSQVWDSTGHEARQLRSQVGDCLEAVGRLMDFHHHRHALSPRSPRDGSQGGRGGRGEGERGGSGEGEERDRDSLTRHRLVYLALASYLQQLLALLPEDKVETYVSDKLLDVLEAAMFDESLAGHDAGVRECCQRLLGRLRPAACQTFSQAQDVARAMEAACSFLSLTSASSSPPPLEEAVRLVREALPGLPYHQHLPLVSRFVQVLAASCCQSEVSGQAVREGRRLLLTFLAYTLTSVRQHAYSAVLQTLQSCLSVKAEASDPGAKSSSAIRLKFLLDSDVLYEIVCFGMADSDDKVSGSASSIVLQLLQCQLLVRPTLWQDLLSALTRTLPLLQSYADLDDALGQRLWSMLDPLSATDQQPLLEKFRGTLRLMFSPAARVRSAAAARLVWYLGNEAGRQGRQLAVSERQVSGLSELLVVEPPRSMDVDCGRSVFKVDSMRQVYNIFTSSPVDPGVKKSAADQLAIMLQDHNLHAGFLELGGLETVLEVLRKAGAQEGTEEGCAPHVLACLTVLRCLLFWDYTLRHRLALDSQLYYTLVRVALLIRGEEKARSELAVILMLLLFDEVAKFDMCSATSAASGQDSCPFTLPAVLTKRYRLPMQVVSHHYVSGWAEAGDCQGALLQEGAPLEMLRMRWSLAWHGGLQQLLQLTRSHSRLTQQAAGAEYSAVLAMSDGELAVLAVSDSGWALQQLGLQALHNATCHAAVSAALTRLLALLVTAPRPRLPPLLHSLDWEAALGRFLAVRPSSAADESLLSEVLDFLSAVLRLCSPAPPPPLLQWLGSVLYQLGGPLLALLNRPPAPATTSTAPPHTAAVGDNADSNSARRSLDKQLLQFITTFNNKLPHQLYKRPRLQQLRGDLARRLVLRLQVTDAAPHFYNLASLEGTLQCLLHLTARPGFSAECSDLDSGSLCGLLLSSLLEVVTAFHVGRGGTAMSFMGRGVTRAATLCLRHLAFEMAASQDNKEWVRGWLQPRQGGLEGEGELGLDWMLTLWTYRDPEVRAAGLGLAVALTSVEGGRALVVEGCRQVAGGVWGAAFSLLLDPAECSLVRQQAALLLVNLTSQPLPSGCLETGAHAAGAGHGPVVMDTESRITVSGVPALSALLQHSQFYQQVALMVERCHTAPLLLMQPGGTASEAGPGPGWDGELSAALSASPDTQSSLASAAGGGQTLQSSSAGGRASLRTSALSAASTPSPAEWSGDPEVEAGLVAPGLLAAVLQLLRNLLLLLSSRDAVSALQSHRLLPSLLRLLDAGAVRGLLESSSREGSRRELAARELLRLYCAVLGLAQAALVTDTELRQLVLGEPEALHTALLLLLVQANSGDSEVLVECRLLWRQVLTLLTCLLQLQSSSALLLLTQTAQPLLPHLTEFWASCLEESSGKGRALRRACLSFLAVLCSEEGRWLSRGGNSDQEVTTLAAMLDTEPGQGGGSSQSGGGDGARRQSPGSILARCLVASYELAATQSADQAATAPAHPPSGQSDPQLTLAALRSLLAISQDAKATALDMGLAEQLIDRVKESHAKLSLETLQPSRQAGRRKEEPLLRELVQLLDLLRNFLCQCDSVKMACHHSGLGQVLHRLWAWCQLDAPLLSSCLLLLASFTANCPAACSSLAYTSPGPMSGSVASRGQLSSNSLVHALVKLAQREVDRPNSVHLRPVFQLLAALALSPECRNILWKSNFLLEFGEQNPRKAKRSKVAKVVEGLWLDLLTNLSFSTEGHTMILKVKDSVDLLVDFVECGGSQHHREAALLVLRNLCCHAPNKPRLLANEKVLPCLLRAVESGEEDKLRRLAASSLWALCYNNQKARVILKGANALPRLQESLQSLRGGCRSQTMAACVQDLKAVLALVVD